MSVAERADTFSNELQTLPTKMRIFSLGLRSLYAEKAVSSSAYNATGINDIRNKTRQDAIVYMKGLLPLSIQLVKYVQCIFEYYEVLELDEWKENISEILEEVTAYEQCCTEILRMYTDMMVPLKKRQNEAESLISKLDDKNKELEKNKAELDKHADKTYKWAFGLLFVPFVGPIASVLLCQSRDEDLAKAASKGKQLSINEAAVVVARDVLATALFAFIEGLDTFAGFFNVIKEELTSIRSRGNQTERARLHHKMMQKKAGEVKTLCRNFHAMIPGVKTDLQCIPEQPGDLEYFNVWLTRQHQEIKKNYNQTVPANLKILLRQCESNDGFQ